ncbi:unnamed protein product [Orchesella dallaii]|uniref:Uncharacterized protein n=2 Tax=Orchesella dallaii TaxID=48710 RepID=A0ABP1PNW9_9HEXA
MKLISGLGYVFHPTENRTLQMFFASPDLFDRKGFCSLRLLSKSAYQSTSSEPDKRTLNEGAWEPIQEFNVSFSTILPEPNLFRKLMSKMLSVGGSTQGFKVCHSDNENAKHECANQDCQIRYGGVRSFFNPKTKECEPTPTCEDSRKHLSPITGACEPSNSNMRMTYSATMNSTDEPPLRASSIGISKPLILCEHGERVTGANGYPNCTCHSGWKSLSHSEWEQATLNDASHPTDQSAVYKMCNVRTTGKTYTNPSAKSLPLSISVIPSQPSGGYKGWLTKTHFWLVVFILIVFVIPCTGILLYIHRSQERQSRSLKAYEHLIDTYASSSGSSEDDEEKNAVKKKPSNEPKDDADAIIAEISNRRESNFHSKRDDDKDKGPPPPPRSSIRNPDADQVGGSKPSPKTKSVSIVEMDGSQKSLFTPASTQSELPIIRDAVEVGDNYCRQKISHSTQKFFNPSSGFRPNAGDVFADIRNNNNNRGIPAERTPSTDELLNLNHNEKHRAHIPMAPVKSHTDLPVVNKVGFETAYKNPFQGAQHDKGTTYSSQSSSTTEVTQQKKAKWAQFMKSVSGENFQAMNSKVDTANSQDNIKSLDENSNRVDESNYKYTIGGTANKVQSLPSIPKFPNRDNNLPQPPPIAIQRSMAQMRPDELASRQEAYRLLSSLSSPTVMPSSVPPKLSPRRRPSSTSIWSNVASENAVPPEPETACASLAASMEDVRNNGIYGNLGSDEDSDEALELLADGLSSKSKSKTGKVSGSKETIKEEPRLSVAEIFERNRRIYGFPQPQAKPIAELTKEKLMSSLSKDLLMLSDNTPSEMFPESTTASTTCSTSTTQLWRPTTSSSDTRLVNGKDTYPMSWLNTLSKPSPSTSSVGGPSDSSPFPQTFSRAGESVTGSSLHQSPATAEAYKIKTSIEKALKASRSRSSNSFF